MSNKFAKVNGENSRGTVNAIASEIAIVLARDGYLPADLIKSLGLENSFYNLSYDDALTIRHGACLPHWTREGSIYAITFRLADAIPQRIVEQWRYELEQSIRQYEKDNAPLSEENKKCILRSISPRAEKYLDRNEGQCWLSKTEIAQLVTNALKELDGIKYHLIAWCIMPNHVHIVIQPKEDSNLPEIMHSLKGYTGKEANKILGRRGQFWQPEYYDHLIRDYCDFHHCVEYVLRNPEKANLRDWKWVDINSGERKVDKRKDHGRDYSDLASPYRGSRATSYSFDDVGKCLDREEPSCDRGAVEKNKKINLRQVSLANAGFTMVEVLAAVAILAIAMAMMVMPFMSGLDYLNKGRSRSDAQESARYIMDTIEKELSQAMDVALYPGLPGPDTLWDTADDIMDPAICAFVLPDSGTYPLQPGDRVIRYWQVWRSGPNAVYRAPSPLGKSWYDKYNPRPNLNRASASDTDSRYVARTELQGISISDTNCYNRSNPAASVSSISNNQKFIAIGPNESSFDVPLLKFEPASQLYETLKRDSDNAFVYHSRYPLWEPRYSLSLDPNYFTQGVHYWVDEQRGEVRFNIPGSNSGSAGAGSIAFTDTLPLADLPNTASIYIPDSEIVTATIGGNTVNLTRTDQTPVGYEYSLIQSGRDITLTFDPTAIASGTLIDIAYEYSIFDPATMNIMANYKTRSLINVSLTVSRRDSKTGVPQDVHLERMVTLKNVIK